MLSTSKLQSEVSQSANECECDLPTSVGNGASQLVVGAGVSWLMVIGIVNVDLVVGAGVGSLKGLFESKPITFAPEHNWESIEM